MYVRYMCSYRTTHPPADHAIMPPQKEQWCSRTAVAFVCCSHPSPLSQACVLHQSLSRHASLCCLSIEMTSSSCAALSGLNARNARKQSSDKLTSSYVALAGLSANMPELSPVNETTYVLCPHVNDQGLRTIIIVSRTSVVAFAWQGGPEKSFTALRLLNF